LLAALGVCGLAMVAGGSYFAVNKNAGAAPEGPKGFIILIFVT
jgi:hypothetical protein